MDVRLTAKTEELVRQRVANGAYESASEVVEAALALLDREERREHLRSLLQEAMRQTRKGDVLPWTPDLERRLLLEAEELDRLGVPINPDVCP